MDKTLDDIIDKLIRNVEMIRSRVELRHLKPAEAHEHNKRIGEEAKKALQELVKECIPKKIKDHPQDPFWKDEMSSNAKMTGYNQAIEDITKALKEKGLL